jgi:fatty acid desaturase
MMLNPDLKELSRRNWLSSLIHIFIRISFHSVCLIFGVTLFKSSHEALAFLVILPHLAASSFLGWAGLGHELFHKSVFPNRSLNTILFRIFSIFTWSNYSWFEITHYSHHRRTLANDDPEKPSVPTINFRNYIQWFTFDFEGFYKRVMVLIRNALGKVPVPGVKNESVLMLSLVERQQIAKGAWVVLSINCGLAIFFILSDNVFFIFSITLAPFFVTFFNKILALSQHLGLKESIEGSYEKSCRTVILGSIGRFFYANMNYHIEHHYFPSVPFYNLQRVHNFIFDTSRNIYRGNIISSFSECTNIITKIISFNK